MKMSPVLFAKAIADETRQKIMSECCCCWFSVNEIVEKIDLSQPTISHHLAILREADLVNIREEGKQTFYTLNQEHIFLYKISSVINQYLKQNSDAKISSEFLFKDR